KIFGGAEADAVFRELKPFFTELRRLRPEATRKESVELYLLGKGYRGRYVGRHPSGRHATR
ncbi:MAG TPA: hypothetical protein VFT11_00590, partial [Candidatus Deferrimicrobiaceae bacterium]|nr:hypothetical protein [Candidatus Deferrimicrobiaceae bacterium]